MSNFWGSVLNGVRNCFRFPDSLRFLGYSEENNSYYITIPGALPASNLLQNGSVHEQEYANLKRKTEELQELQGELQGECSRYKARIASLEDELKEENANSSSRIEELQKQLQGERRRYDAEITERENQFQHGNANLIGRIEELQKQLQDERSSYEARIVKLVDQLKEENTNFSSRIEELQKQLQDECSRYEARNASFSSSMEELQKHSSRYEAEIAKRENEFQQENANLSGRIEELQKQLQGERTRYEAEFAEHENEFQQENANLSGRIEELQKQLQGERTRYEAEFAEHENQFQQNNANLSGWTEELQRQLQNERHRYEERIAELEDQLERLQSHARDQIAAKMEEIQKLVKQLELAEHKNSHDFAGGESFLDTEATPHLLNKAVERVNTTSGSFTKLLMLALKNGGVDCTNVAKALAKSVSFERDAHTKFVYQTLVCKALFTDFESECFNIEDNAPESLDPEQPRKENFQRYKQLILLENPEELIYEDATDSDFRRFCNKKQKGLIAALSLTGAPGVDDVGVLIFGEVFGPDGIRRQDSAGTRSQNKVASSFVKFALSVFLVHKLAFSMHPIARIFRVRDAVEFIPDYMESVVASADSEDEDTDSVSLNVGFMVVPGFFVNRIVVHSRVYTVKRA